MDEAKALVTKASGQTFNFNCSGKMDTFQVRFRLSLLFSSSSARSTRADAWLLQSSMDVCRNNLEPDSPSNELLPSTSLTAPRPLRRRSGRTGWRVRFSFDAYSFPSFLFVSSCLPFWFQYLLFCFPLSFTSHLLSFFLHSGADAMPLASCLPNFPASSLLEADLLVRFSVDRFSSPFAHL